MAIARRKPVGDGWRGYKESCCWLKLADVIDLSIPHIQSESAHGKDML